MSTRGRNVSVIFGDGAGAALVTRYDGNDDRGILSSHLHSEGKHAEELSLIGPSTNRWVPQIMEENDPEDTSYYPNMNGQFVFKNAVVRFSEVIKEGLLQNQLAAEDIKLLVPRKPIYVLLQFVQKKIWTRGRSSVQQHSALR